MKASQKVKMIKMKKKMKLISTRNRPWMTSKTQTPTLTLIMTPTTQRRMNKIQVPVSEPNMNKRRNVIDVEFELFHSYVICGCDLSDAK